MVDYVGDVGGNGHALAVEGVLDALEQLYEFADGQHCGLGHGLPLLRVQVEGRSDYVADVVGEQHALQRGGRGEGEGEGEGEREREGGKERE